MKGPLSFNSKSIIAVHIFIILNNFDKNMLEKVIYKHSYLSPLSDFLLIDILDTQDMGPNQKTKLYIYTQPNFIRRIRLG